MIFASLVAAGVVKGVKEVRDFRKPGKPSESSAAQIAAVTLLENATLNDWTRSNKTVVEALSRLCDLMVKHHDELVDHRHETSELRHAIHEFQSDLRHRGLGA